jgi:ribA/ribD-fused uncharacterized protein
MFDGTEFHHSEGLFIALKAYYFNRDRAEMDLIAAFEDPKDAKAYGRKGIKCFNQFFWEQNREMIMEHAVYLKFKQNAELRYKLMQSDPKILVEASPYDRIWGVGITVCPDAADPKNWKGLNLLGIILMRVRERLKRELLESLFTG